MTKINNLPLTTRILIIIAIMTSTLMQSLDMTIVNVALPHMQSSLSANSTEITWVLTSFLIASAIFTPLTGYFTDILGQKKYLMLSIVGFVITSILCGLSRNITQIVTFRLLQGMSGAALIPLSQSIMANLFSDQERGKAMALWGMGVMVGPILGPTLGGYITEWLNWNWNFYINVPIGIICLLLTWQNLPDTAKQERNMDWIGLILISGSIGALQFFLDRGNVEDWFDSRKICISLFLTIICLLCFILHTLINKNKKIVFNIEVFSNRNFIIATSLVTMFGLGLFGVMVILPPMLENLFNYPVITTGLVMAPRGISSIVGMICSGKLIQKVDPRWLILCGVLICCYGTYLGTSYNLHISSQWIIGSVIIQGLGFGMVFVPLSTVAFTTLPANLQIEASGLFNLMRTIGSSMGISIVSNVLTIEGQTGWNQLGGFINPFNYKLSNYLQQFHAHHNISKNIDILLEKKLLLQQSQMFAFVNAHKFIACSFLVMIPFIFLLQNHNKTMISNFNDV